MNVHLICVIPPFDFDSAFVSDECNYETFVPDECHCTKLLFLMSVITKLACEPFSVYIVSPPFVDRDKNHCVLIIPKIKESLVFTI